MKRREFLLESSLALAGTALAKSEALALSQTSESGSAKIRFGVIADLHQDFAFDAPQRLQAFIDDMNRLQPDFIVQLGDFCVPIASNRIIVDIWSGFKGSNYHVIGNHDMDQHKTRAEVVSFLGMPSNYYSFDRNGFHFIVADCNDPDPRDPQFGNIIKNCDDSYPAGISDEQMNWLSKDLASTHLPTIVFCHQGFDNMVVPNREAVRTLFENTPSRQGNGKVVAVFSGHFHQDYYNCINGIHYIQINSSTYKWFGSSIDNNSFSLAEEKNHPSLKHMGYYLEPLWAFVEISDEGILEIRGRKTIWKGKSPHDLMVVQHPWGIPPPRL